MTHSSESTPRIYLDNAATSWPKPEAVYVAVDDYQRHSGVAVGRGATRRGGELQAIVDRCRRRAAGLIGAPSPQQVAFTLNATDALNTAIHGLLRSGDHVVTSVMEHNSVLRPLSELHQRIGIEVTYVAADAQGRVDPQHMRDAITPRTKLIALTHASNVTGTIQPIADVAEIARAQGIPLLVDAAQTAGVVPINVAELGIDLLCCAGHKGLLGPLGTGLLYVKPGMEDRVRSLRQGGTGSRSEDDHQPAMLPDLYESGNHNAPGLVGLDAALGWIEQQTLDAIRQHEQDLTARLQTGLAGITGVTLFGPDDVTQRTGVISLNIDGYDPRDVSVILDENFDIETRAGFHCAPRAHRHLGTASTGGTVRFSVGPFNTPDHITAAIAAIKELATAQQ